MNKDVEKPKLSKEQIEALMKQMMAQGGPRGQVPNQSRFARYFNQFLQFLSKLVKHTDRFINFIVKPNDAERNDVVQYSRAPMLFGTYVIILFFGIGFLWAAIAPLNSAAGAAGVLINDSHRQLIQNPYAGVVKAIYVKLGDRVTKGQKLVEIEDVHSKARYEQALNGYRNALASVARLNAEKDDLDEITFPEELLIDKNIPEVQALMDNQVKLFNAKVSAYKSKLISYQQKKEQELKQLESLKSKKISTGKQSKAFKSRLDAQKQLLEEGHTTKAKLDEVESQYEHYRSEDFTTNNEIAKTEQAIVQTESEIKSFQSGTLSDILKELRDTTAQMYHSKEESKSFKDAVDKEIITSPVDGIVNVINIHTIGGYVSQHQQQGQGATAIMEITPDNEKLVIDAKIPQSKIAHVHVGLEAVIRFGAFKSRTSPSFKGTIVALSSDAVDDQELCSKCQQKDYLMTHHSIMLK